MGVLVGVGRECVRVEREREVCVCVCVCVLKGSACVQRKSVLGERVCVLRGRERENSGDGRKQKPPPPPPRQDNAGLPLCFEKK